MTAVVRKSGFAVVALVAIGIALVLILYAAFPYIYAESGSAAYARAHRGEAAVALIGAIALSVVAWLCVRRSFALRWWAAAVAIVVVTASVRSMMESRREPEGAQSLGGNWYAVSTDEPREAWKVRHHLYYKHGSKYESIEEFAAEYQLFSPDCVIYRPITSDIRYAMCGYRSPASSRDDPSMDDAALLEKAAGGPPYERDWQSK
jgi:hypothetical protein